jgi:hypothetical protein
VIALIALATRESGYPQPIVGQTVQYLPRVFKGGPTKTPTLTPTRTSIPVFLRNGGFEDGQAYWQLTGRATVTLDASRAHSGMQFAFLGRDGFLEDSEVPPAGLL